MTMTDLFSNCFNRHRQDHSHAEARGASRAAMMRLQYTQRERERGGMLGWLDGWREGQQKKKRPAAE